jgi:hypothetical protein
MLQPQLGLSHTLVKTLLARPTLSHPTAGAPALPVPARSPTASTKPSLPTGSALLAALPPWQKAPPQPCISKLSFVFNFNLQHDAIIVLVKFNVALPQVPHLS